MSGNTSVNNDRNYTDLLAHIANVSISKHRLARSTKLTRQQRSVHYYIITIALYIAKNPYFA